MPKSKTRKKGRPGRTYEPSSLPKIYRHNQDRETQLKMLPHMYLTDMCEGKGDEVTYLTLALRVFTGKGMAEFLGDQASREQADLVLDYGLAALWHVGDRFQHLDQWDFAGEQLMDVREALVMVDSLQEVTTRKEHSTNYAKWGNMVSSVPTAIKNLKLYAEKLK